MKFVTFFSIRWTTLGPATARILKYWTEINLNFDDIEQKKKEKDKLVSEKTIIRLLSDKTLHAEVTFVNQIAEIVEPVLTFLERKDQVNFQADHIYLIAEIQEEKELSQNVARQANLINEKLKEEKERAQKF